MSFTKSTSTSIYNNLVSTGYLSKQRAALTKVIIDYGKTFTINELIKFAIDTEHESLKFFREPLHMNKLPADLERQLVIRQVGVRKCESQGTDATEWEFAEGEIQELCRPKNYAEQLLDLQQEVMRYACGGSKEDLLAAYDVATKFLSKKGKL